MTEQMYPCRFLNKDECCRLNHNVNKYCSDPINAPLWCNEYWPICEGVI
jgi:hypothetical protein